MPKFIKHKDYFSGAILSAYLFVFILNIFHYHSVNLLSDFQIKNDKKTSTNTLDLNFLSSNAICQFQITFSSIHTIDSFNNFVFSSDKTSRGLYPDNSILTLKLKNFPKNNPLRAPPSGK